MNNNQNKYLCIFYNYKETAEELPKKYRGQFWELVITYAFDGEEAVKSELETCNKYVKIAFFSIKNLLKLNKKAGSQNGISNNISGLAKVKEPNIAPNITPNLDLFLLKRKEKNIKEIKKKPTKEEVIEYAKQRNRLDLAEKFYDYFSSTDWVDSKGNKVKNWKGKFLTWESHTDKPVEVAKTWWRE